MIHLISVSTYILDMLILATFLEAVFMGKGPCRKGLYRAALAALTILLHAAVYFIRANNLPRPGLIEFLARTLATLPLCFFFASSMKGRIMASLGFALLSIISGLLFTWIILAVEPTFMTTLTVNDSEIFYDTLDGGARLILLLACVLLSFERQGKESAISSQNRFLLLSTPAISLMIYCALAASYQESSPFYYALFVSLALLNSVNHVLARRSQAYSEMEMKTARMRQQIEFQKEKYRQLSESYRRSRRLIHDVKKHYFSIQEYVKSMDLGGCFPTPRPPSATWKPPMRGTIPATSSSIPCSPTMSACSRPTGSRSGRGLM